MLTWIYSAHLSVAAILMTVIFVGFAWVGTLFLRPIMRLFVRSRSGSANDTVGAILSSFGVLYGILLGLTAVAAYENWSEVDQRLDKEASALLSLYNDISTYPQPITDELSEQLGKLVDFTIREEWELLRQGSIFTGAGAFIEPFKQTLFSFEPSTKTQEILHAQAVDHLNEYLEQRRFRVYSVNAGIPAVLWYVVILGAVLNIALIWLLDTKLIAQLFLGGLLAFFLGAIILMIARLDKPFRSNDGVTPDALRAVHQVIANPAAAGSVDG